MDLEAFSKENFDPKEWINNALKSPEAAEDPDRYASSMVMRLQLAIQEVNISLEETSSQVVMSLPRVIRDVEAISHEASILRGLMSKVGEDIEKVERNAATSMQTLVELDAIKNRLVSSSKALKEADNWTTLSTDIEEVMDSGDVDVIADKLTALQNCLQILTHVPDFEERVAHLEGLKVRLESLICPHVICAFTQHNLEESVRYARILSGLGRYPQLESYYHKCEVQQLLQVWRSGLEGSQMSGPPLWLSSFYDHLAAFLAKQMKWCGQVFEKSSSHLLLTQLTQNTLNSLDPSVGQVISIAIKQQDDPLGFLGNIKSVTESFLMDFQRTVGSPQQVKDDVFLFESQRKVVETLYDPIKSNLQSYTEYEESLLLSNLTGTTVNKEDLSDSLQSLRNYCQKVPALGEGAVQRCLKLTNGWCFPSVITAIETFLETVGVRIMHLIKDVKIQVNQGEEDWATFRMCLILIECAGGLLSAVDTLDHSLATHLLNYAGKMSTAAETSFAVNPSLLLTTEAEARLDRLVQKVNDDAGRILEGALDLSLKLCHETVEVTLSSILLPVKLQLSQVSALPQWNVEGGLGGASPLSASFSPQEYMTQIGQYLLTLPQHLDIPLLSQSEQLRRALHEHSLTRESPASRALSESETSAVNFFLSSISNSICHLYTDAIMKIPAISHAMVIQLTTDIDYLCNIMGDLGVLSVDPLDKLNNLLKAPVDQYWSVAPGNPPRLVAAVRQMRDIPATS